MASTGPRHSLRPRHLKSISVLECFHLLERLDAPSHSGRWHPARPRTLTCQWLSWDGTISLGSNESRQRQRLLLTGRASAGRVQLVWSQTLARHEYVPRLRLLGLLLRYRRVDCYASSERQKNWLSLAVPLHLHRENHRHRHRHRAFSERRERRGSSHCCGGNRVLSMNDFCGACGPS